MDGVKLYNLLVGSQGWVHRRVIEMDFTSAGQIRHEVILDFTYPTAGAEENAEETVAIPLALMEKGVRVGFDVRSQDGQAILILTTSQNVALAEQLMVRAFGLAWPDSPVGYELHVAIREVVGVPSNSHRPALEDLLALVPQAGRTPKQSDEYAADTFFALAHSLSRNYLLLGIVPSSVIGRRTVVSYTFLTYAPVSPAFRQGPYVVYGIAVADPGFSASLHLEVVVPEELDIPALIQAPEIVEPRRMDTGRTGQQGEAVGAVARVSAGKSGPYPSVAPSPSKPRFEMWQMPPGSRPAGVRRAHLHLREQSRYEETAAVVWLEPANGPMARFSIIMLGVLTGLVAIATVVMFGPENAVVSHATIPSPGASVLLGLPALVLSWMARRPENVAMTQTLAGIRLLNMLSASVLFAMAGLAAVPVSTLIWFTVWTMIYLALGWGWWIWLCRVHLPDAEPGRAVKGLEWAWWVMRRTGAWMVRRRPRSWGNVRRKDTVPPNT